MKQNRFSVYTPPNMIHTREIIDHLIGSKVAKSLPVDVANLWAAGPDLLLALERIVKLARLQCKNSNCSCVQCEVVRECKAAIAKARGEL